MRTGLTALPGKTRRRNHQGPSYASVNNTDLAATTTYTHATYTGTNLT